jgi:uncharacterized repeat protein (TIGR01451 family)
MPGRRERRTDGRVVTGRRARRPRLERLEPRALMATIVVTGTGDTIAADGIVTLREAITAANTNAASGDAPAGDAGLDTIAFNIPGAGVQTIRPGFPDLPEITDAVMIDGFTQPGASPNLNPITAGSNAVLLIELTPQDPISFITTGLRISAGNSTVRGLAINRFQTGLILQAGGGNTIAGNYLGTDPTGTTALGNATDLDVRSPDNTIGGTAPADRNLIAGASAMGIRVNSIHNPGRASGAVIQGNFIGTDATGARALPNLEGLRVEGELNASIGGTAPGARNLISGNTSDGIGLVTASGTVIQGNFIGTDVTGATKLGNGAYGVREDAGRNNTIGGTGAGAGNVISGNGSGLSIDRTTGDRVQGNFIGTDFNGMIALGNTAGGVSFENDGDFSDITVGGTVAGSGNTIAFNTVAVGLASDPITILGNSIYANGRGTVELVQYAGPNPPELTSVTGTSIAGTLRDPANTTFRLEFFATPNEMDQGKTYLGETDALIDGAGNATFVFSRPSGIPAGQFLTATATSALGTSAFSRAITIPVATGADLTVSAAGAPDPVAPADALTYTITVTDAGPDGADGVLLTSAIPANATFISFTAPPGWTATTPVAGGAGAVSATTATLASGAVATFTLAVRVAPGASGGSTITDTSTVSATTNDPNSTNNSASGSVSVATVAIPDADLSVTATTEPGPATVGDSILYTIFVGNIGANPATGAVLTVTLPAGVDFVSASVGTFDSTSRTLTAALGNLGAGADATVTITARANSTGTLTSVAHIQGREVDPNPTNNTSSATIAVNAAPTPVAVDLAVVGLAAPEPVAVGQELAYTLTVTARGESGPATGVTLVDTLPVGVNFVSTNRGVFDPLARTITASLGTLAAGATDTMTIVVRPTAAGTLEDTAVVTANESDPVPDNNGADLVSRVTAPTPRQPDAPPMVIGVQRFGIHMQLTRLVLRFSAPLDSASAQDTNNYRIISPAGRRIAVDSAFYDATAQTVALRPHVRLNFHRRFQLTAYGAGAHALLGASGAPLDGTRAGHAGSDFKTVVDRSILILRRPGRAGLTP